MSDDSIVSTVSESPSTLVKRICFTRRGHITLCCSVSVIALVMQRS